MVVVDMVLATVSPWMVSPKLASDAVHILLIDRSSPSTSLYAASWMPNAKVSGAGVFAERGGWFF
jgi:hypothetical protein